jgi:hypothetical protein
VSLTNRLTALDERIRSINPAFHEGMGAGATDSELDLLRAATGALPADVAAWYRWHAGSGSGLVPGTEWGLLTIKEALAEIAFAKSSSGPPELSSNVFVPILTGRDGRLMYYVIVPDGDAAVWEHDRGDRVKVTRFEDWLEQLTASWTQEGAVLRVAWVRRERSPMGWHELHLPSNSRAKLKTLLRSLPLRIQTSVSTNGTSDVRFEMGAPSWRENEQGSDDRVVVSLSSEGAQQLSQALADKSNESFRIPDVEDLRLKLSQR